ncbi:DUF6580 family putative transport protein [Turneriella parva]|uniref:Uncharacterized protein n=1 Tax=Turneriella parva (strain ATCC BAA-1111 / DSM 21527 / NCTC 11395 / H) TaxID=869212 RepID=I4B1A8_TURPD|nr:DUF6580 family putative transport protein [Turneriella parva]AFM11065.1 hypothetical protein Turpa_0409 [Turneriella parva DSM 21527]
MKSINPRFSVLVTIVFAAAFSRVIPHLPNLSPLNAAALFAAAHFSGKAKAIVLPLGAVFLSDLFLNNVTYAASGQPFVWFYPGFYWQYSAYAVISLFGLAIFRRGVTVARTVIAALVAGLIFFSVSNFGVWAGGGLYPPTFAGLVACYAAALPFYQGTLMGDAVFVTLLFGGFHIAQRHFVLLAAASPNLSRA